MFGNVPRKTIFSLFFSWNHAFMYQPLKVYDTTLSLRWPKKERNQSKPLKPAARAILSFMPKPNSKKAFCQRALSPYKARLGRDSRLVFFSQA